MSLDLPAGMGRDVWTRCSWIDWLTAAGGTLLAGWQPASSAWEWQLTKRVNVRRCEWWTGYRQWGGLVLSATMSGPDQLTANQCALGSAALQQSELQGTGGYQR